MACTFSTSEPPKVARTPSVFNILTSKCASRHNGVHFFDIWFSKSGPNPWCFYHLDFEMCFAPQRRPLFWHLNFQKWSENGVFWTFLLGNVLRATTACTFLTSQLPKVVRTWCALYILTWRCASRHNGVQLFIFHLANWLRTCGFSEPTFRPSGATNHWKNTLFRDFPTFSRTWVFFLLRLSLFWSSFFFSSLLWLFPCFSSVHIVGSLTSKLPSANGTRELWSQARGGWHSFLFHDMTGFNARSNSLSGNHTYAPKPLTNPNFLTTLLYPSPVPARHSHPTQWHKLLMFSSRPLCNGSCRGSSRPICKPSPWTDAQPSNVAWRRMRRQSEAEGPCWCGWISALGRVRKFLKRILVVRRICFPQTWECSIVFHSHLRLATWKTLASASDPQSDLAAGPSTRSSPVICCESSAKQDGWRRPISQNLCKVWNATPRSTSTCLHNNTSNRFLYIYTMWIYVIILFWYMQGTRTLGRVRIPCFRPMIAQALPNWQPGEGPSSNGSKGALASTWWLNMGHTSCSLASPCGPNEAMLPREFIPWLLMSCNDDFDFDLDAWSKSWSSA